MKLSNVILGLGVIALMSACSNDEPATGGAEKPVGNKTFLQINIATAPDSRAADDDANYVYGSASEHEVVDAQFFFFDEAGLYVGKAQRWDGGSEGTTNNVEWIGKNVIVLDNQESNTYPTWVMTVLNAPDFSVPARSTLAQASRELRNWSNSVSGKDYFVMSTTSFYGLPQADPDHYGDDYYYATKLKDTDFLTYDPATGVPDASDVSTVVDIYVERLAAKVQLTFEAEEGNSNLVETLADGSQIFKTDVTIMGEPNTGVGNTGLAATEVYVKVFGWDLSATAPQSYLSKQLKAEWLEQAPWAEWNFPNRFRSFWAESTVYDQTNPTLNHKKYNDLGLTLTNTAADNARPTNIAYCNENTNTAENVTVNNLPVAGRTTSVLLKAQLCIKDAQGNYVGLNGIKYNGSIFTYERYKDYILDQINKGIGALNIWTKGDDNQYTQIDGNSVKFMLASAVLADENLATIFNSHSDLTGTGKVLLVANLDPNTTYYAKGDNDEQGNPTFTAITNPAYVLNQLLAEVQKLPAEAFGGEGDEAGAMYYTIPVEHETSVGNNPVATGYYGVVRNHWYQLSVSNIVRLGHGVFDPENEDIIGDEPENPRYYVAARINILSWKIVKQNGIIL